MANTNISAQFFLGPRGAEQLFVDGFRFIKYGNPSITKQHQRWRCSQKECGAKVSSPIPDEGNFSHPIPANQLTQQGDHNHDTDYQWSKSLVVRGKIRERALERPDAPPRFIISDVMRSLSTRTLNNMPSQSALRSTIRNARRSFLEAFPTSPSESSSSLSGETNSHSAAKRQRIHGDSSSVGSALSGGKSKRSKKSKKSKSGKKRRGSKKGGKKSSGKSKSKKGRKKSSKKSAAPTPVTPMMQQAPPTGAQQKQ